MFKKIIFTAAAAMTALTAMPTAASAQYYDGYYGRGGYSNSYNRGYRGDRYYRNHDRRYYGRSNYYRGGRRCSGTTGTIVGAIAGGLLGDAVVGRRGDETAGAIIGAGVGALAGRAIDKGDCRRR